MFCNHCGNFVEDGNAFCPVCGAQVGQAPTANMQPASTENTFSFNGLPPVPNEKKGLSITSMVLGISSAIITWIQPFIAVILALVGLILGCIGVGKGGKGMGITGIVLSAIFLVINIVIIVIAFIIVAEMYEAGYYIY